MKDINILDGAIGTLLMEQARNSMPSWKYNMEEADVVHNVHRQYIEAGSDIIYTNTFQANAENIKNSQYSVEKVVKEAIEIAKSASGGKAKVALDVGCLTTLLEPYGDLEEDECRAIYEEQIGSAVGMGVDYCVLETFLDVEMIRIAGEVARKFNLPTIMSMTFDQNGRTLMGNRVSDLCELANELNAVAVGLNCSLGADLAVPVIAQFKQFTDLPLLFKPNAGKPIIGTNKFEADANTFVKESLPALAHGVKFIGGCCGTDPSYIKLLKSEIAKL